MVLILWFWGNGTAGADPSRSIERMIEAMESEDTHGSLAYLKKKRLQRGEGYYRRFCLHCHGSGGGGKGGASRYLLPAPRDFQAGVFKFRSTRSHNLPLAADLFRTIKNGLPGTAMPAWGKVLPDDAILDLVEFVKTFSGRFQTERPDQRIEQGLEPPFDRLSLQKGKALYRELRCARCHGEDGTQTGFLAGKLKDHWGHFSLVYDINQPRFYKGGALGGDIFQTLTTGMDGTAMGAYDFLPESDRWHLTHFLQSRFIEEARPGLKEFASPPALVSRKVEGRIGLLTDHPDWRKADAITITLRSIRVRKNPAPTVKMRSLRDETSIAFLLEWDDPTPDTARAAVSVYLDAVALQFAAIKDHDDRAPFFGMGERGKPVNIWHWRADADQRVEPGGGPPADSEGKNLLSLDPFRRSPVEELNAEGFGSLTVQSLEDQQVRGRGVWRDGRWRVVLIRDLATPGPRDVQFGEKDSMLMAVALWDGSARDKNASKTVSLWQSVRIK
ncbi:hypothetical protein UR09_01385 [Candidatus Nitromaritima sp. SCGC AAA799-A02]|nr:hypothetical protein UR09_01385 [Candidatus Nitromaritima sp. SCGC AAA799-A02]